MVLRFPPRQLTLTVCSNSGHNGPFPGIACAEPTNYFDKYVWPMYQQFGSALDGDGSTFARPVIHEIEAEVSPETLAADVTAVCERLLAIER